MITNNSVISDIRKTQKDVLAIKKADTTLINYAPFDGSMAIVEKSTKQGQGSLCKIKIQGTNIAIEDAICPDSYLKVGDTVLLKVRPIGCYLIPTSATRTTSTTSTPISSSSTVPLHSHSGPTDGGLIPHFYGNW